MKTYNSTTSERQLFIYQQLTAGRHIQKSQLAKQFAVDARTIQRDFASLRAFMDEYLPEYTLNYDRQNNSYWLSANGIGLNKAQCLCLIKILTASRALPKSADRAFQSPFKNSRRKRCSKSQTIDQKRATHVSAAAQSSK